MTDAPDLVSKSIEVLGSHIEIKIQTEHAALISSCFDELRRIDETYSRFRPNSVISQINKELGVWHTVSDELLFLVSKAKELNEKTNGEFDCTIKSDLERLGYDKNYSFVERKKQLKDVFREIASKILEPISVEPLKKKILIRREIELGGFGKGFALDIVAQKLQDKGVTHYYINAGGDIYAKRGKDTNGKLLPPWEILLEHPDDFSSAIGKMELDGLAVACSAPNRRKWKTPDGKEHHHLINAKTRMPQKTVKSIFVLANTGLEADGYATALFAAGFESAIELSKKLPVKIILISAENKMFISQGFPAEFFD